jgi:hypothetical protein
MAGMNIAQHVKPIVKDFVDFWQQDAAAKKAELPDDEATALPLYARSDDDNEHRKRRVYEEDLVRFVPWGEGRVTVCHACIIV